MAPSYDAVEVGMALPAQSVTTRAASAIVNIPWAITSGKPTARANRSFQWIGLKSPEAPA